MTYKVLSEMLSLHMLTHSQLVAATVTICHTRLYVIPCGIFLLYHILGKYRVSNSDVLIVTARVFLVAENRRLVLRWLFGYFALQKRTSAPIGVKFDRA